MKCAVSASCIVRELTEISRIIRVQHALKNGEFAIRDGPTTKPNGRDEQRSVEQASKYESVFKSDPLIVESAVRKVTQEFFVRLDLEIWLMNFSEA